MIGEYSITGIDEPRRGREKGLGEVSARLSASQEHQLKEMLKMTNVVREIEKDAAEKAAKEAIQHVAQKMLRLNIPVEQIAEVTQLSLAEIDALRSQLAR